MLLSQLLGKKDILATLHPGPPPAESSSLGTQQRKTLGVLSSLAGARQGDQAEAGILGHRGEVIQPLKRMISYYCEIEFAENVMNHAISFTDVKGENYEFKKFECYFRWCEAAP